MKVYDYVFTGRRKVGDVRLGVLGLGEASSWFDSKIIDGIVNDAGWVTRAVATLSTWWDKWIIDGVGRKRPGNPRADLVLSRAPVRMGLGAVVCIGNDRRFSRFCCVLRVEVSTAPAASHELLSNLSRTASQVIAGSLVAKS